MPIFGPLDRLRLLGAASSGVRRLTRAAKADHTTIDQRWVRVYSGTMTHAFLHAATAPSRRIRPATADQLGECAAKLAGKLGLPAVPYLASSDSQRFVEVDGMGSHPRSLFVTRTGVVELLWALEQLPTADGSWAVRALDACVQLTRFADVVAGDDYARLLSPSRRRLRRPRIDWALGITTTTAPTGTGRDWRDILMAGPQPDRASGHDYGFMPPSGYGVGGAHPRD